MGDNTSLLSDYYGPFSLYLGKALPFSLSLTFSIPAPVIAGSKHLSLAQITVSDRKSTTFYGHFKAGFADYTGFRNPTLWTQDYLSVELGFRITIVCGIPNSQSWKYRVAKPRILGCKSKNFEDSRIPDYLTWERYINQELNHRPVCINNLALKESRFPKSAKPHGSH